MSEPLASYTFLPWFRQGLANYIKEVDLLSENPGGTAGRPKVSIEVTVQACNQATLPAKDVAITGPGDVVGINEKAIIKVDPAPGTNYFEHNYLPFIAFYDEDLPWRYSPATPDAHNRLRPWIFLMALKEDEFEFRTELNGAPLPSIQIKKPEPLEIPTADAWAWAHVQVNKKLTSSNVTSELAGLLQQDPDAAFSRLMCPRKLERSTKYHLFLLPFFEAGRRAGLGLNPYRNDDDTADILSQTPAWKPGETEKTFPFYYHWSFATSDSGDFETLARKLVPVDGSSFQLPDVNIQDLYDRLGAANSGAAPELLQMAGALKPVNWLMPAWTSPSPKSKLTDLFNGDQVDDPTDDPVVNMPTLYGRWHRGRNTVSLASLEWFDQLNIDPRYRSVAALGGDVVRNNQEKFMDEAWEQVGAVLEANQVLRQAQMATEVGLKWSQKHLSSLTLEDLVMALSPVHRKVRLPVADASSFKSAGAGAQNSGVTVARHVHASTDLTRAGTNPGFRKTLRPGGKVSRQINGQNSTGLRFSTLISNLNSTAPYSEYITAAKQKPTPYGTQAGAGILPGDVSTLPDPEKSLLNALQSQPFTSFNLLSAELITAKNALLDGINPIAAVKRRILGKIPIPLPAYNDITIQSDPAEKIKPVMCFPVLPHATYKYLEAISSEFILPGISEIAQNTVSAFETDQKFIEAFLVGLNHEMARELLWREYPTDQRGSYFRRFWNMLDTSNTSNLTLPESHDQIQHLTAWMGQLGSHRPATAPQLGVVLVLRGELFQKFPETTVYAHRAKFSNSGAAQKIAGSGPSIPVKQIIFPGFTTVHKPKTLDSDLPGNIQYPILRAAIAPDILIIGFELTAAQARGNNADPGWFFMFQERPGEPRFGLDFPEEANDLPTTVTKWEEFAWQHLATQAYAGMTLNSAFPSLINIPAQIESPPDSGTMIPNPELAVHWGNSVGPTSNAGHMAYILLQTPVLLGIHASDLILPPSPPPPPPPVSSNGQIALYD